MNNSLTIYQNSFPQSTVENEKIKPFLKDFYAIIWLKRGYGRYFIDFKEYQFKENSIIIISKNQETAFQFNEEQVDFLVVTFSYDYIKSSREDIQKLLSFCIREHFEGKQIIKINKEDEEYLKLITDQLLNISRKWEGDLKQISEFYFLQLFLTYCVQLSSKQQAEVRAGYTDVVANFTTMLEKNFRQTQKVDFYTNNLNLTYNSLSRYTTQYCNKSPKEIIVERLILEIKRLLAGTKTPIKEIAYSLGFDEPTNFVKYFKKYTGTTPSEFRRQK